MADAFETGDASYIAKALGVVARAKGMTEIAEPDFPVNSFIGHSVSGQSDFEDHSNCDASAWCRYDGPTSCRELIMRLLQAMNPSGR